MTTESNHVEMVFFFNTKYYYIIVWIQNYLYAKEQKRGMGVMRL